MTLPAAVAAISERHLERLHETPGGSAALAGADARVRDSVRLVFACSDFVAEACLREPDLLSGSLTIEPAERSPPGATEPEATESQFSAALRRFRRREMVRIAWRDLAGFAPIEQTFHDMSALADAAVGAAQRFGRRALVTRFGEPVASSGLPQPFVIVAMGKLGGIELNFSSDIDLVFLFPERGETHGAHPTSNEEFFGRLGQSVIRLLDARTDEGIVFRVDIRLRPFGESGPLVTSFSGLEDYLQSHGRDWERYAWVKARAVTGEEAYAGIRQSAVRPFVFRRYLDFGVFESLREMKALIEREVQRRDLLEDIKLGPGGIREIEFIVQAFQLIRGGRDRRLQQSSLLTVLPLLDGGKGLPRGAAGELRAAYLFLRRLENRLQMLRDEQTHRLPKDPLARSRIAAAMGAEDWETLAAGLARHREHVTRYFDAIIRAGPARSRGTPAHVEFMALWESRGDRATLIEWLRRLPSRRADADADADANANAEAAAALLIRFRESAAVGRLDTSGSRRLQELLPALLEEVARVPDALNVLRRALGILEAIGSRSAYFALLHQNAGARSRLIEVCAHGEFLASQIAAHPLLLDELLDERLFEEPGDPVALASDLERRMQDVALEGPERQVETLREYQRAAVFRIAVADLSGRLPVTQVSDRLTQLAELIIDQSMRLAGQQMTAQFGTPRCGPERRVVRVCAVGYGKLGGRELGYGSDLDLVFLHDSAGEAQETDARPPLDNGHYFVRLAQRMLHLLTLHSAAGRLYEVDVRLRPSGKGGLLITQIDAFADYQRKEAWTWEHQSLLHARAVAGDAVLRARFEDVRLATLTAHVRRKRLAADVRAMRARMHRQYPAAASGVFHLKRDAGGITDIEFLAQYWALSFAEKYPPVVLFSDTIRELESVASADLVPQATVDLLTAAYRRYREVLHHRSLEHAEPTVPGGRFDAERETVMHIWRQTFG